MQRFLKRYSLWFVYALFLILAIRYGARESFLDFSGPYAGGKIALLIAFIAFVAYSVYATSRENFFRSVVSVNRMWWGLQIGLDLYISVFISLAVIYLHEGSIAVLLAWLVPVLFFANLAILPYLLLNYSSLVSLFGG